MVTGKKASVEGTRVGTRQRTLRGRPWLLLGHGIEAHSLAPEHIGEAGSVAVLAMAILGLAIFIAAIAMLVFGLTTASATAAPPPNVGGLGMGQVLGGLACW